jgi:hypothetical protein
MMPKEEMKSQPSLGSKVMADVLILTNGLALLVTWLRCYHVATKEMNAKLISSITHFLHEFSTNPGQVLSPPTGRNNEGETQSSITHLLHEFSANPGQMLSPTGRNDEGETHLSITHFLHKYSENPGQMLPPTGRNDKGNKGRKTHQSIPHFFQ